MSLESHKEAAGAVGCIRCTVITVSDTRSIETDRSGRMIQAQLLGAGHAVTAYHIIPDDEERITQLVQDEAEQADAILLSGGTGVSRRDVTSEAIRPLLDKHLPGFGELFRMLSYQEIGPAAMLSRAVGGMRGDTVVFALPGSPKAVSLALTKLILPELPHLVGERRKGASV